MSDPTTPTFEELVAEHAATLADHSDADLRTQEEQSLNEFDRLHAEFARRRTAGEKQSPEDVAEMERLAVAIKATRQVLAGRAATEAAAEEDLNAKADALIDDITRPDATAPAAEPEAPAADATADTEPAPAAADTDTDTTDTTPDGDTPLSEVTVPDSPAGLDIPELVASAAKAATEAATTAAVAAAIKAMEERHAQHGPATTRPAAEAARKLNPTMADIAAQGTKVEPARRDPVLVASADVPGFGAGAVLDGVGDLRKAMRNRVKRLPDDHGQRLAVATINKEHRHVVGESVTADQMEAILKDITDPTALVAAGGWCAPSEIDYNFFSVVCRDGGLDLPTVGVNRGGIQWPISPTYAEIVGNTGMWSWTETQDAAAVTGTAQSGEKTCTHIPCADFLEARLHCDGLCLTAGNLTSEAFPELIDNYLDLLQAGHFHRVNGLRIQQLVAASVPVSGFTGLGHNGSGVVANVLGAVALQAQDYRAKYRMCQDSVLEVVLPIWLRDAMRSDLIRRNGIDVQAYADQQIMTWFDVRNVRVQWVYDWQDSVIGGATPALLWPSTVQFLIFAPGTFVLGEGMSLDLGVIRDSTLNATNDYTLAWMEECWLIAQRGHESRLVTVNICPDGTTGAADITACAP